jgi:predicted peroxiredoxin
VAKILVHITHGTEHPTRAALGFHVAKAAIDEGHFVTLFNLRELYDAVVSSDVKIYLSGMSSKSRGLSEEELEEKPYEFGYPRDLVRLSLEHDRLFTY